MHVRAGTRYVASSSIGTRDSAGGADHSCPLRLHGDGSRLAQKGHRGPHLPVAIDRNTRSDLALGWREEFFSELHARSQQGLPPEDERHHFLGHAPTDVSSPDGRTAAVASMEIAVRSWHTMGPWSEVVTALGALKDDSGLELFVLANGTTRMQLDLVRFAGLEGTFSMLFSGELLGCYKPAPEAYEKALGLVRVRPDEARYGRRACGTG
ncbi:hypothetical protein F4804DRAFT_333417 [Jackrogersella minutella]|nr:hypothetical protein F4804DRAFT_333417 [Jackrogersella minutella]